MLAGSNTHPSEGVLLFLLLCLARRTLRTGPGNKSFGFSPSFPIDTRLLFSKTHFLCASLFVICLFANRNNKYKSLDLVLDDCLMPELRHPHSISIGRSQVICSRRKMFVVTSTTSSPVVRKSSGLSLRRDSVDDSIYISPERLAEKLLSELKVEKKNRNLLILDCRSPADFARTRIEFSTVISVVLPSILEKRLLRGTLSPSSVIASKDVREWFLHKSQSLQVVLIPERNSGNPDENGNLTQAESESDQNSVSQLLLRKLRLDGVSALLLRGMSSSRIYIPKALT